MEERSDDWRGGTVLLDVSPGDLGEFDRAFLERIGHPVIVCHGPPVGERCPLLGGQGCSMFDQAHGIVFKLDIGKEQHREILRRYRQLARPDLPIRVVVNPDDAERYGAVLNDVEIWTHEPNVAELDGFAAEVEAVDRTV